MRFYSLPSGCCQFMSYFSNQCCQMHQLFRNASNIRTCASCSPLDPCGLGLMQSANSTSLPNFQASSTTVRPPELPLIINMSY
ncbi:unnamed protein product [Paramecium primaurelia]|uniref:Uncharacterized protein n=1 Tax=Paramecium primaurelia TaxID=5886 RepID=A0A8S1M3B4_PARPR|nr:unnamed protein product [Paramecium primaurelia]